VKAVDSAAALLVNAWQSGKPVMSAEIQPQDRQGAYAIQDAMMQRLGRVGGWKVGARGETDEPACAPLPASVILPTGTPLPQGLHQRLRVIEVEVAFRLGRDLLPGGRLLPYEELASAFDAMLPVIEFVETRLSDWAEADPLAKLADLQSHGALVLGAAVAMPAALLDFSPVQARLSFDGKEVASTRGGNPAVDVWRLLAWQALHCEERGMPLRAGQIVTTRSLTGMLSAAAGAKVEGLVVGLGPVRLDLA
jgi:2-keto-4-pentenoate hydratase